MNDIWYLIGYIHVVGWLMACGQHYNACRVTGKHARLGYVILLVTWPHYLGIK